MSSTRRIRVPASSLSRSKSSTAYLKGSSVTEEEQSSNVAIGELLRKIESFAPHKDTFVSNLDGNKFNQLKSIRETANYLKDKKCYKLLINKIHETYDDDVKVGTVGAFFKGSFISDNGGPCSKMSAGSFPRPPTPGWKDCDKNVATLSNGSFHILNTNSSSSEMLVYIDKSEPFVGFSDSVVSKMKSMGVRHTTILTDGDGEWETPLSGDPESLSYSRYSEVHSGGGCDVDSTHVDTLPRKRARRTNERKEKRCDYNWGAIAVIAFVILLLFAGAIWWWRSRSVATTPAASSVVVTDTTTHYGGPGYIHA